MILPNSSLPLVIVFERHWDCKPREILAQLLTKLSREGYNTFCYEAPHNVSEQDLIQSQNLACRIYQEEYDAAVGWLNFYGVDSKGLPDIGFIKLRELMKQCVTTTCFNEAAERIKLLPATLLLTKVIRNVRQEHSYFIKGIDLDEDEFVQITHQEIPSRMKAFRKNEKKRINNFVQNLLKLRNSQSTPVFLCGVLHADNLIKKLKETIPSDDFVYYFIHSNKQFDDNLDDIKSSFTNETTINHTFCVRNEQEQSALLSRIVSDIKSKNTKYIRHLEINSHSEFLSQFFHTTFVAFERPGHYVDALLDISTDLAVGISEKLDQAGIKTTTRTFADKTYLVVPDVNERAVAESIRRL